MFTWHTLWPLLLTAGSLILTPGPAKLLLVATSAARGARPGLQIALEIFVSDAIHVTIVAVGLGALIVSNALARKGIALIGAGCLLYFAFVYARKAWRGAAPAATAPVGAKDANPLAVGLLLNLLNPIAIAFYVGLLPQFADPSSGMPVMAQLFGYGVLLILTFLAAHVALAFAASRLRGLGGSPLWFRASYAVAAAVLIWLCVRMLLGTFASA